VLLILRNLAAAFSRDVGSNRAKFAGAWPVRLR
jgi:hypothetical protein